MLFHANHPSMYRFWMLVAFSLACERATRKKLITPRVRPTVNILAVICLRSCSFHSSFCYDINIQRNEKHVISKKTIQYVDIAHYATMQNNVVIRLYRVRVHTTQYECVHMNTIACNAGNLNDAFC